MTLHLVLAAAALVRVAVPPLALEGNDAASGDEVSETLAAALDQAGCAQSVPPSQLGALRVRIVNRCGADAACLAAVGRDLKVAFLLTGSAREADFRTALNVRLVDVEAGKVRQVFSARADGSLRDVSAAVGRLVPDLCRAITGAADPGFEPPPLPPDGEPAPEAAAEAPPEAGAAVPEAPAQVPAAALQPAPEPTHGARKAAAVFLGGAGVAAAVAGVFGVLLATTPQLSSSDPDWKAHNADLQAKGRNAGIAAGVAGGMLLVAGILWIADAPPAPKPEARPAPKPAGPAAKPAPARR